MSANSLRRLQDVLEDRSRAVVPLPALIRGELVWPSAEELQRAEDRTGASSRLGDDAPAAGEQGQGLVHPRVDPAALIEDRSALFDSGYVDLPFDAVQEYVAALRDALAGMPELLASAADRASGAPAVPDRGTRLAFEVLPTLLDPEALARAVDRELGDGFRRGRDYLDGWVEQDATPPPGMTARMSAQVFPGFGSDTESVGGPRVRAMPTRQLHITAGSSPLMPFLSFVRALATKGAAVIKSPAEAAFVPALLGAAMDAVDPHHPITRHTSMVYWRGGDRSVEDALLRPEAFERILVWGSRETIASVTERARDCTVVPLRPRCGAGVIGREAFPDAMREVAIRACADSLIANQAACTASLVHFVEAGEARALEYCETLRSVLAEWDRLLPHVLSPAALGRIHRLRRGSLVDGTWFRNEIEGRLTSAVVYTRGDFDFAAHPSSRFIVVRSFDGARDVLARLGPEVSTVGVFPEELRRDLRERMALRGVSNILPLGQCERAFPGMPHDGRRISSELVEWSHA